MDAEGKANCERALIEILSRIQTAQSLLGNALEAMTNLPQNPNYIDVFPVADILWDAMRACYNGYYQRVVFRVEEEISEGSRTRYKEPSSCPDTTRPTERASKQSVSLDDLEAML